jgi:hypothetical protein
MNNKKQTIPLKLKCKIWNERIGISDITKCILCGSIICIPEEVRKRLKIPIINGCNYSNAHYGHVLAEHRGGLINESNLQIICMDCNVHMGTEHMDDYKCPMDIDNKRNVEYMSLDLGESNMCIGITRNGKQCKKKRLNYCNKCGIHKGQNNV